MSKFQSRFAQLRAVLRVARTYHTRTLGKRHTTTWIVTNTPKAFRRAYAEVSLLFRPAECIVQNGIAELQIDGKPLALATNGRLITPCNVNLSPKFVNDLSTQATHAFIQRIKARMTAHGVSPDLEATKPFFNVRNRWARPFVIGAIRQFLSFIDPEALRLARRCWLFDAEAIAWLTPADPLLALRRRQAIALYPLPLLHLKPWDDRYSGVAAAIDAAMPLVDAIAREAGVRPSTIRRMAGILPARLLSRMSDRQMIPWSVLDALPPALFPANRADFKALTNLDRLVRPSFGEPGLDLKALVKRMPTTKPLRQQPLISTPDGASDFRDVLSDLRRHNPNAAAVLSQLGLTALDTLNRDWHRAVVQASAVPNGFESRFCWPAGFEPFHLQCGDLHLVELTTAAQLAAEGIALKHCVGTYAAACAQARSRILSVRDAGGQPVSTIEVNDEGRVVQHRGHRNGAPPREAIALQAEFEAALRSGRITLIDEWPSIPLPNGGGHGDRPNMSAFWRERGVEPCAPIHEPEESLPF